MPKDFCQKWKVELIFRGAHKLSGNEIVEKNHRSINSRPTAARSGGGSPLETVEVESVPGYTAAVRILATPSDLESPTSPESKMRVEEVSENEMQVSVVDW